MDKLIWWGGLTSPLSRNSSLTNALQCQIAMHLLIHSSKLSSHHLVHHHHHHHQDQWHVNEAPVSSEWLTGCRLPGWVMVATRNWPYCTFLHPFQLLGMLYNVKPFQLLGILYNVEPFQLRNSASSIHKLSSPIFPCSFVVVRTSRIGNISTYLHYLMF